MLRGHIGVTSPPLVSSTCANEIPAGTPKSASGCVEAADIMYRVHIGTAASPPDKTCRRVVVEADPRQRQRLRREADEPRIALVVRRTGLSGSSILESHPPRRGGGAAIENATHHVDEDVDVARGENLHRLDVIGRR